MDDDEWEVLHPNPNPDPDPHPDPDPDSESHEIDSLILADYFSLDSLKRYGQDLDDNKSAVSDNPSWIDPAGLEENPSRYLNKESTDFWSDSSSDSFLVRNEMNVQADEAELLGKVQADDTEGEGEGEGEQRRRDEIDKMKSVVWWKMPLNYHYYFVFRMSPVWTVSVAAAFMGFVILGRSFYKMKKNKKKARGLQIKVAVDDKVNSFLLLLNPTLLLSLYIMYYYYVLCLQHLVGCCWLIVLYNLEIFMCLLINRLGYIEL